MQFDPRKNFFVPLFPKKTGTEKIILFLFDEKSRTDEKSPSFRTFMFYTAVINYNTHFFEYFYMRQNRGDNINPLSNSSFPWLRCFIRPVFVLITEQR